MSTKEFTVADLIEYLKTQDQGAIAQVVVFCERSGWEGGGSVTGETFDPEKHTDYTDFRGNQFVKPTDEYYNKRYLVLGST